MASVTDIHQGHRPIGPSSTPEAGSPLDGVEHSPALIMAMAIYGACDPAVQDVARGIAEVVSAKTEAPAASVAVATMQMISEEQRALP